MTHGSLFSGIGGFDLAAEWMGWENVFHCEIEPFPRKVLNYYWPNAISYEDIKKTDFTGHSVDVLSGGFPCQPFSLAGKRKGTEDDRHLWPEMLRAIREIRPRWVVGENVYGIVNWDGGLVFEQVQADLESEGYEVFAVVLPACAKGAPHRRDRTWFVSRLVSDSCSDGRIVPNESKERGKRERCGVSFNEPDAFHGTGTFTNPNTKRLQGSKKQRSTEGGREKRNEQPTRLLQPNWKKFPTQPPVRRRNDGVSEQLDGITISKWSEYSIKAYGNAIVPQIAYEIFKVIES